MWAPDQLLLLLLLPVGICPTFVLSACPDHCCMPMTLETGCRRCLVPAAANEGALLGWPHWQLPCPHGPHLAGIDVGHDTDVTVLGEVPLTRGSITCAATGMQRGSGQRAAII
jgi:hypothetical protein